MSNLNEIPFADDKEFASRSRPLPNIRRADYRRRKALEVVIIWGAVGLLVWYLLSH